MLPDDDNAEDAWVAFDNAVTHKLRSTTCYLLSQYSILLINSQRC